MEHLFFRLWNAKKSELSQLTQQQTILQKLEPQTNIINQIPFSIMAICFRAREA